MTDQTLDIKAGSLIVLSSGEYSDYGYSGAYVALQDVSKEQMLTLCGEVIAAAELLEKRRVWQETQSMFISAMIRNGWLLEIHMQEIHIGSYGSLVL